jgi:hypothetical protein
MTDLNAAMERLMRIGPSEAMREDELTMGFTPIRPGEMPWFPAEDWSPGDVASIKRNRVRIVAIKAQRPGTGAFSRLITALAKAGMVPLVVEPMFAMPNILRRWGWKGFIVGNGIEKQEIWRPTLEWLQERALKTARCEDK